MDAQRVLRLDVDGSDVVFTDPGTARSASRKWKRMAREIDTADAPEPVREKVRELRARAKACDDWARSYEDLSTPLPSPAEAGAEKPTASPRARGFSARGALRDSGLAAGTRRARKTTTRAAAKSVHRYERAAGAKPVTSIGELLIFFAGSVIGLALLEDLLSGKGPARFATATKVTGGLVKRVVDPVPLVAKGG